MLLELFAALYYLIRAAHKDRKQRRKKKKVEKSLFREWVAKQNFEIQEQQKNEQKEAKNPNGAAQEQILSQKQELDEMRTQAAKLLHAINKILVDFQVSSVLPTSALPAK